MVKGLAILVALLLASALGGCKKGAPGSPAVVDASAASPVADGGCDHDLESSVVLKHSWPYPAELRDLRWVARYTKVRLRLRPVQAAFFTGTLIYRKGDYLQVEDSQVHVLKPRRLVAKRDLYVRLKVWEQGARVEKSVLAAAKGELGSFLFYNSRGSCLLDTEQGPGWTECTLEDAFEGLSPEDPYGCEQVWWVKIRRSKVDQGWMPFDATLMERVAPQSDAAK